MHSDALKVVLLTVASVSNPAGREVFEDTLDKYTQAVRDEEFALHELKENCRWDGPPSQQDDSIPCARCPCHETRYCP